MGIGMREKVLEGKLVLLNNQGMEYGYLAILDNTFRQLSVPQSGLQENRRVWDINDKGKTGLTSNPETFLEGGWRPSRDPLLDDADYKISSLLMGEIQGDLNADKRLMQKYNFSIKYVKDRADEKYGVGKWKFSGQCTDIVLLDSGIIASLGDTPKCIPERPFLLPKAEYSRVTVTWADGTIENNRLSNTLLVESWAGSEAMHRLEKKDYLKIKSPHSDKIECEGDIDSIRLHTSSRNQGGHFKSVKDGNPWEEYFVQGYRAQLYREVGGSKNSKLDAFLGYLLRKVPFIFLRKRQG